MRRTSDEEPSEMPRPFGNRVGRRGRISEPMRKLIADLLDEKPDLYRDELDGILEDEFASRVSRRSLGRALHAIDCSESGADTPTTPLHSVPVLMSVKIIAKS